MSSSASHAPKNTLSTHSSEIYFIAFTCLKINIHNYFVLESIKSTIITILMLNKNTTNI